MKKRPVGAMLLLILGFLAVSGLTAFAFLSTETVSQKENRTLAAMPELTRDTWFSGGFASALENYLSDHVFDRNSLVSASQRLEGMMEKATDIRVVRQEVDIGVDVQETAPAVSAGAVQAPAVNVQEEEYLILNDRIVPVYQSNDAARKYYWQVVNACYRSLPDSIHKHLMLVPSRIEFEEESVRALADSQKEAIDHVYKNVDATVNKIDAYGRLADKDVDALYFRTDHHWTALAAYYGAQALFESVGRSYLPIEDYDRHEVPGFLGYLYAKNNVASIRSQPDTLTYYLYGNSSCPQTVHTFDEDSNAPVVRQSDVVDPARGFYYTFVESSFSHTVIEGRRDDGSCILVVGDSYANVLMPWLADNFARAILIDPRYFTGGHAAFMELFSDYGVTDFLIADYAQVLTSVYFTAQIDALQGEGAQ